MNTSNVAFVLAIAAGPVLLALVAIVGGFLHYRRERVLTHHERMKALELGRELPDDAATARIKAVFGVSSGDEDGEERSLARKCFSTALWVAFWGFLAASQGATLNAGVAVAIAIAASAGAVGVAAMICGTVLALRTPSGPHLAPRGKPVFERDAFDAISPSGR